MDDDDDLETGATDREVLKEIWPRISSEQDQRLAKCREWVENATYGQIPGLWVSLRHGKATDLRDLDADSLSIVQQMALVGLCAAIGSVVAPEESQ